MLAKDDTVEGKDPAGWYPKLMNAAVMVVSKTRPVWVRRKRKRMKEEGRKREDGQPSDGRWMDGWVGGRRRRYGGDVQPMATYYDCPNHQGYGDGNQTATISDE